MSFEIRVRPRRARGTAAATITDDEPLDALRAAIDSVAGNATLHDLAWADREQLCCLDLDFHDAPAPPVDDLRTFAAGLRPRPSLWWVSGGGGLHAVYVAELGEDDEGNERVDFGADELGAAAAIACLERYPLAEVELLRRTAQPPSPVVDQTQNRDGALAPWFAREADAAFVTDDWLAERGYVVGESYTHERCPVDPRATSKRTKCVVVHEDAIHCFVCEAKTGRGHWPIARLAGAVEACPILDAARAFVHWEQMEPLLGQRYPGAPARVRRLAYRAMLKLAHDAHDPRLGRAFAEYYIVRSVDGIWLDSRTLRPVQPNVEKAVFRMMPSATFLDDGGAVRVSPTLSSMHSSTQEIPGLPTIKPLRGAALWGVHNSYPDGAVRVAPPPGNGLLPARYLPPVERTISEAACWETIDRCFPGVDHGYLTLLVVARAIAESGEGAVPMLMVSGPTGAAKSYTVRLAASIVGDDAADVSAEDSNRLREAIGDALPGHGYLLLDEFGKTARAATRRALFDALLGISRTYTYRRIYVGHVSARFDSVVVLTNNVYPDDVIQNQQLGRRFVYVPLHSRTPVKWEGACGTGDLAVWRREPDYAGVADHLLSFIVDRHVPSGADSTALMTAARKLGYGPLEEYRETQTEGVQTVDLVRRLFELCCSPEVGRCDSRWTGSGWVAASHDGEQEIDSLWRALCDSPRSRRTWATSIKVAELDLASVLGCDEPVVFDASAHEDVVGLRFRGIRTGRVNEQLDLGASSAPDVDDLLGGLHLDWGENL